MDQWWKTLPICVLSKKLKYFNWSWRIESQFRDCCKPWSNRQDVYQYTRIFGDRLVQRMHMDGNPFVYWLKMVFVHLNRISLIVESFHLSPCSAVSVNLRVTHIALPQCLTIKTKGYNIKLVNVYTCNARNNAKRQVWTQAQAQTTCHTENVI